ncbi:MAG: DNA repair protein RecO [Candidatus Latescibacteria bacterium]|nr:DNA repair protein RecO [Candidatus Latescibacterota bacterium]
MARFIVKTRAIVLRTWRLGETSKLVSLYTEDYGKVRVSARGARKPKSKFGGALEVASEIQGVCYIRTERTLQTLSECQLVAVSPELTAHLERWSLAQAACELVDRITIEEEANQRLYACLAGVLKGLAEVGLEQLEPLFWYYQLRAAEALGFRPELRQCVSCRKRLEGPWLYFDQVRGGGLCPLCGTTGGRRVAGASLQFLAGLQALRPYTKEKLPPAPPTHQEIGSLLQGFVEYHGGTRGGLKALQFHRAVAGAQAPLAKR